MNQITKTVIHDFKNANLDEMKIKTMTFLTYVLNFTCQTIIVVMKSFFQLNIVFHFLG